MVYIDLSSYAYISYQYLIYDKKLLNLFYDIHNNICIYIYDGILDYGYNKCTCIQFNKTLTKSTLKEILYDKVSDNIEYYIQEKHIKKYSNTLRFLLLRRSLIIYIKKHYIFNNYISNHINNIILVIQSRIKLHHIKNKTIINILSVFLPHYLIKNTMSYIIT